MIRPVSFNSYKPIPPAVLISKESLAARYMAKPQQGTAIISPALQRVYFAGHPSKAEGRHAVGPIGQRIDDLTYPKLQALDWLEESRESCPVKPASQASTQKVILQAVEIGFWNMKDLTDKATQDIEDDDIPAAANKMMWVSKFSNLLGNVSSIANIVGGVPFSIATSPAYQEFIGSFKSFDEAISDLDIDSALTRRGGLDSPGTMIQKMQLLYIGSNLWESYLDGGAAKSGYAKDLSQFIGAKALKAAVQDLTLEGDDDNRFTQFRALHQIPEILVAEVNEHLATATEDLKDRKMEDARRHLEQANLLLPPVLESLTVLGECLTLPEYHDIRTALEATSGSQSLALRTKLFNRLYKGLSEEWLRADQQRLKMPRRRRDEKDVLLQIARIRTEILNWKSFHRAFPFMYLGTKTAEGEAAKSLIGGDAYKAVCQMILEFIKHDPLRDALKTRGYPSLDAFLQSPFDATRIVTTVGPATAALTAGAFGDVQDGSRRRAARMRRREETIN